LPTDKAGTIELEVGGISVAIHGHSFPGNKVTKNLAKDYPEAVEGSFNIGILHTSLDNPESAHKTYAPCILEDLREKDYEYWALGHIHIPQVLHKKPHIIYSGNIQGRSIREVEARGCYLVKVNPQREIESCEMQELDVARWFKREVDLSDLVEMEGVQEAIGDAFDSVLEAANGRVPVVRLELVGQTPLTPELQTNAEDLRIDWVDLANEKGVWLEKVKVLTSAPEAPGSQKTPENYTDLLQSLHNQPELDAEEFLQQPRIKKLLSSVPKALKAALKDELTADLSATTQHAQAELESQLLHPGN
jgi:exonuclease SbcD